MSSVEPVTDRIARNRQAIREWMETAPCADCGSTFPWYVLEFDHVDGRRKVENRSFISTVQTLGSLQRKMARENVQIVCANCHAIRTHTRRVSSRKGGD
jgi:5-methylcytosine-specific restriction endonuclease McrA